MPFWSRFRTARKNHFGATSSISPITHSIRSPKKAKTAHYLVWLIAPPLENVANGVAVQPIFPCDTVYRLACLHGLNDCRVSVCPLFSPLLPTLLGPVRLDETERPLLLSLLIWANFSVEDQQYGLA